MRYPTLPDICRALMGVGLIGAGQLALAAPSGAFTFASVDIFDSGPLVGTTAASSSTEAVFAERGSEPAAYGKSRASFGSNGFAVLSGAAGLSIWSDGFTFHGSTDTVLPSLTISVSIHGAYVGPEADMSYALLVSDHPFDLQDILDEVNNNEDGELPQLHGASVLLHTGIQHADKPANVTLNGAFAWANGQTFYIASIFQGDVCTPLEDPESAGCQGGSEDFFHSANFGISALAGGSIATLSNTVYATAVPEVNSVALTLAGMASLLGLRRRAQAHGLPT